MTILVLASSFKMMNRMMSNPMRYTGSSGVSVKHSIRPPLCRETRVPRTAARQIAAGVPDLPPVAS